MTNKLPAMAVEIMSPSRDQCRVRIRAPQVQPPTNRHSEALAIGEAV